MKPRSDISISQVSCGAGELSGWRVATGSSSITVCPVRSSYSQQMQMQTPTLIPVPSVAPYPSYPTYPSTSTPMPGPIPSSTPAASVASRGLGSLLPALKWGTPDYKLPWGQMKFNLPEMYAPSVPQPSQQSLASYASGIYNRIKTMLVGGTRGRGSASASATAGASSSDGTGDTTTTSSSSSGITPDQQKMWAAAWQNFGVCLKKLPTDATDPSINTKINSWYDKNAAMMTTGLPDEKAFMESMASLQKDIGAAYKSAGYEEKIWLCLFGAITSASGSHAPSPPPTAGAMLLDNRW